MKINTSHEGHTALTADAIRIHALLAATARDVPAPERGRVDKYDRAALSLAAYNADPTHQGRML